LVGVDNFLEKPGSGGSLARPQVVRGIAGSEESGNPGIVLRGQKKRPGVQIKLAWISVRLRKNHALKKQLDAPFSRVFFADMIRLYQDIPWGESITW